MDGLNDMMNGLASIPISPEPLMSILKSWWHSLVLYIFHFISSSVEKKSNQTLEHDQSCEETTKLKDGWFPGPRLIKYEHF